jgi:hypothetical protein
MASKDEGDAGTTRSIQGPDHFLQKPQRVFDEVRQPGLGQPQSLCEGGMAKASGEFGAEVVVGCHARKQRLDLALEHHRLGAKALSFVQLIRKIGERYDAIWSRRKLALRDKRSLEDF